MTAQTKSFLFYYLKTELLMTT